VGGWVGGWMDGWMDGWIDKWMDILLLISILLCTWLCIYIYTLRLCIIDLTTEMKHLKINSTFSLCFRMPAATSVRK